MKRRLIRQAVSLLAALTLLLPFYASVPLSAGAEVIQPTELSGINTERKLNYLVAYTDKHESKNTGTDDKGIEAVINKDGVVISVGGNNSTIPGGGFVLSGSGTKKTFIEKSIKAGYAVYLDEDESTVTVIPDDYNPFYSSSIELSGVNSTRYENTLIVFNGSGGKTTTGTNEWGYEVSVDKNGFIIKLGQNNNVIPEGGLVLSAIGSKKAALEEIAKIGMSVEVNYTDKVVTVSYSKENAVHAPALILQNWKDKYAQAKAMYKILDYSKIDSTLSKLENEFNTIKDGIEKEDMLTYTVAQNRFDKISADIKHLLVENSTVEGRALWIRPTQKNDNEVKKIIKEIYEMGFNIVCVEGLYNNTMIMPQPQFSLFSHSPYFGGYDVLRAYIDECHRYGMELHLWMPVYRVGHDASTYPDLGLGNIKREWRNIANTGVDYVANVYGNGHFLNPALPEVQEHLLSLYRYILENYPLDGFQLDYIRYPDRVDGVDFGYDTYTRGLFEAEYGVDPINISTGHSLWNTWCLFRAQFVTDFVLDVKDMVQELRPDIYLSADVAPSFNESITRMMQDTTKWISEAYIDIVYPMAYGTVDRVNTWSGVTVSLAGDDVFTYIGVGNYGADVFFDQMLTIRNTGADGVAFFAYAEFASGEYDSIPQTLFAKRALSPTFNGKKALIAQLKQMNSRINDYIAPSGIGGSAELVTLSGDILSLISKLEESSITACKNDIEKLVADINSVLETKVTDENAIAAVRGDLRLVSKITALTKDDWKAEYYVNHPLPDMYDLSEDVDNLSNDTASADDNEKAALNSFEKIARTVSIVIISFSILGLPLYFYLDRRKKRMLNTNNSGDDDKEQSDE